MHLRLIQLLILILLFNALQPHAARAEIGAIAAIVEGDVITDGDVDNRVKLFALSTGMPTTADVLARLRPQITRQLIDEKLRMEEIEQRHIVVPDQDIATAIHDIEKRNRLPDDGLRMKLQSAGVAYRALVDQIRVQIGWNRVLRQALGERTQVSDAEVDEQMKRLAAETGKPEYRVAQIFIPVDNPDHAADANRFASTIIAQLRHGAAFPIVAAQFSQSQNALQGGDEGWVHADQLDPAVAEVVAEMPPGAISNPIPVPGGIAIVNMLGKRQIGRDLAELLSLRQVFLPFTSQLDPQNPTEQQKRQLEEAKRLERGVHDCTAMEAANKAANSPRPANPGDVRLDQLSPPPFRDMIAKLPLGQVSKPLIAPDGIGLVMVCSRETRNLAQPTKDSVRERLLSTRIDLESRQLLRDLQRRASIRKP